MAIFAVYNGMIGAACTDELENLVRNPVHIDGKGCTTITNQRQSELFFPHIILMLNRRIVAAFMSLANRLDIIDM